MGFEKQVLNIADECGLEDAHFYQGTLFFSSNNATLGMIDDFCESVKRSFTTKIQLSYIGNEISADFCG